MLYGTFLRGLLSISNLYRKSEHSSVGIYSMRLKERYRFLRLVIFLIPLGIYLI